ncbi:MAG: Tm-1-like ATP-binding domain-containing protein [Rhizobiaceae bacterium]|nr:Tm-1-like ATP-binding domain-containing protein [Rhizobiaceae bacterium]
MPILANQFADFLCTDFPVIALRNITRLHGIPKRIIFRIERTAPVKRSSWQAEGAGILARQLNETGKIDGMIALGGTMGTDLALEVACALPLGVPKIIISTFAFSPLVPPERLAADVQMILWAGGLFGLNSICKSSLNQAAGAIYGAALASEKPDRSRPMIGMASLGKTCLNYMVALKPALEERGFQATIFHSTGMGGRVLRTWQAGASLSA